jgi:hypothetical protein
MRLKSLRGSSDQRRTTARAFPSHWKHVRTCSAVHCFLGADGGPDLGDLRTAFAAGRDGALTRRTFR